jgi:hypothetical protein
MPHTQKLTFANSISQIAQELPCRDKEVNAGYGRGEIKDPVMQRGWIANEHTLKHLLNHPEMA